MVLDLSSLFYQFFLPQTPKYKITGQNGPYNKYTSVGRSANAGNEFASLADTSLWKLKNSDVTYSTVFSSGYGKQVNINNTLAYSTEALKGIDANKDGITTTAEVNQFYFNKAKAQDPNADVTIKGFADLSTFKQGQAIDLNCDGKVDAGEWSAWNIYQDGLHTGYDSSGNITALSDKRHLNGTVTTQEAKLAEEQADSDPNAVKTQLQSIYNINKIADAQTKFTMPAKVSQCGQNQNYMQQLLNYIMMILRGGFGSQHWLESSFKGGVFL